VLALSSTICRVNVEIAIQNPLVTHILSFEGDSEVRWFEGSYSEYEQDHLARLGTDAIQPHRIKYKRLEEV
jgi:hypothetical protein